MSTKIRTNLKFLTLFFPKHATIPKIRSLRFERTYKNPDSRTFNDFLLLFFFFLVKPLPELCKLFQQDYRYIIHDDLFNED